MWTYNINEPAIGTSLYLKFDLSYYMAHMWIKTNYQAYLIPTKGHKSARIQTIIANNFKFKGTH